jgi:hypothetical protein
MRPARHALPSLLFSLEDEPWQPSPRLLAMAGILGTIAPTIRHPVLSSRGGGGPRWYQQFPGEHYHLLTAICGLLRPAMVWEFGTDRGMSTVAMLEGLRPEARLYTVDIDDWRSKPAPWLVRDDFDSGRVTQLVCDMRSEVVFADHLESLSQAELIFVDGPKDGVTETAFLDLLDKVPFRHSPVVVFDDIRLMNMVGIWRGIPHPKMDMTSFGHWSGTGLVDWRPPDAPQVVIGRGARLAAGERGGVGDPAAAIGAPVTTDPTGTIRVAETTDAGVAVRAAETTDPGVAMHAAETTDPGFAVRAAETKKILLLCHAKPNYVPDLLLHGLRKLLGAAVVDYPRKDALYDGCLGQPYLDRIDGLMAADTEVDRLDIPAKTASGFFDMVLCDIRAVSANQELLRDNRCPLVLIDGEDRPARLGFGQYVILRRETDGGDFSVPLPMAMPVEVLDWIDRHADMPKTHNIGFLGSRSSLTPDRNAILDELCRICPDALIDAWGVSDGKWQGRDAYYRALQSCEVVLTLPGAGLDTFRYWENAACNAAHAASRMPLFIPNDFRDGHEIVRFSSIGELTNAVERLGSGAIDGRALAERSRQWLRKYHTTERRAATTLDRLNAAFLR